ncbi:DUF4032 domain-containing protein [Citricoccus sp. SGAir0253]|uniref:DUF4032 domain-containing protein n=1 Tax=Citricoccus sp. SGAir0253 TaxID=2567881 RepID=UPI0010CD4964|nr:DUF4032 domain-containing protein [Citricoccus sp. SGAir0253]QCU78791.1 DUF4032 domain-containing protein [Citricoccus sp. SGAir0253]
MAARSGLDITTSVASAIGTTELLALPWDLPLEDWPTETLAALPRGISRHVVRFAHLAGAVVAVKETTEANARREYQLLRRLERRGLPCVEPVAVVGGRTTADGGPLPTVLVTRHLRFSLPYRAVFSRSLHRDTVTRLIDALALLLVELHLVGFYWGDVSLSNTLFRRDAGAFAAYLVDAETGELHPSLSTGQREHDLEIARVNIAGELMDLLSGGMVDPDVDPVQTSEQIIRAYRGLWEELTGDMSFRPEERWRVEERIRRLNALGFDVEEYAIRATADGDELVLQPKVVDPGHHQRRLLGLTGLDVQENQARRLLRDIDQYREDRHPELDEEEAAHLWVEEVFDYVARSIPAGLTGKLEPAEVMHQLLEHRWYLSERQSRSVPLTEALDDYLRTVLPGRRDEDAVMLHPTTTMLRAVDPESGTTETGS